MKKNTIPIGDEELTEEMLVEILSRYWKKNSLNLMIAVAISFLGTILSAISFLIEIENPLPFEKVARGIGFLFFMITEIKSKKEFGKFRNTEEFRSALRTRLSLRDRLKPLLITILYCIAAILLYIYWGPIPGLPSGFSIQLIIHLGIVVLAVSIFFNRQPGKQRLFSSSV